MPRMVRNFVPRIVSVCPPMVMATVSPQRSWVPVAGVMWPASAMTDGVRLVDGAIVPASGLSVIALGLVTCTVAVVASCCSVGGGVGERVGARCCSGGVRELAGVDRGAAEGGLV